MSRARPMRPFYRRRGVTLIEMLIVISLLGIVGIMALPKVRAAQRRAQLRTARDIVSNYLSSARRAALTRSAGTRFEMNNSVISVTMRRDDGTYATILSGYDLYGQYKATLASNPTGVTQLSFDKRGLMRGGPAAGNTVILVLTNDVANQRDSVCVSGAGLVLRGSCR